MPQKVFMGAECTGDGLTCNVIIVGEYNKVLSAATDHIMQEHEIDLDTSLIIQTIRDYNEAQDGTPHECSHV